MKILNKLPAPLLIAVDFCKALYAGAMENRILVSASSLSYSTLLGLGPLIAVLVMVSGFMVDQSNENFARDALTRAVYFIAPSAEEFNENESSQLSESAEQMVNPALVEFIDHMVASTRSGAVGVVGTLVLIVICIQLITAVEKTFNHIWGVSQGRSTIQRIILYWTVLSLGLAAGVGGMTLVSASTLARMFDAMPFSGLLSFRWLTPLLSAGVLTAVLAIFYRFIPNTNVRWKAAFWGGFLVTVLLLTNNYFSFLYVHKAISTKSLYGSIGIIPILMFGLYIFWIFILAGGQITYAVQNFRHLQMTRAWSNMNRQTHELLVLNCLVLICERFERCQPPSSASWVASRLKAPVFFVNQAVDELLKMDLVVATQQEEEGGDLVRGFIPKRPLDKLTLADFYSTWNKMGNAKASQFLQLQTPIMNAFNSELQRLEASDRFQNTFAEWLEAESADGTKPTLA